MRITPAQRPSGARAFGRSLALRPKQLRAAAEESAFRIPGAGQLQLQYQGLLYSDRIRHEGLSAHRPISRGAARGVCPAPSGRGCRSHGTYADATGIAEVVAALALTCNAGSIRGPIAAVQVVRGHVRS